MTNCQNFVIVIFLLLNRNVSGEVFTALVDLGDLLVTEQALIALLENYITAERQKIYVLNRYLNTYQKHYNKAIDNPQLYLSNPINAYTLVKKLTDWAQVETLISSNIGSDTLANITHIKENMKFPTDEDLHGAATALIRLQETYQLETSSLARGELNGVKYSDKLGAVDCFELGRQSYINENYYYTQLWMAEAEARLKWERIKMLDGKEILEYLFFSTYKQGKFALALNFTNTLLNTVPNDSWILGNITYYKDKLKELKRKESQDIKSDKIAFSMNTDRLLHNNELYLSLCRGQTTPPEEIQFKLKCRYVSRDNHFLKIAPFKVEEAYLDPDLYVFYDVLSDEEIETIKQLAHPRFTRATVYNSRNGTKDTTGYRISKSAWLEEKEHKHIVNVNQRIADMTGLSMDTAEYLQVANYGIGGYYELHYDFASRKEENMFKLMGSGNRIATVLFYYPTNGFMREGKNFLDLAQRADRLKIRLLRK